MDCVLTALNRQCDTVILCGRSEAGFVSIPDRPGADLGPLGGLNAALHYGLKNGFSHVLSAGVDAPNLPHDLAKTLSGDGPAIVQNQPVIGLWPTPLANDLEAFLNQKGRALYGFAETVGARRIAFDPPLMNVNSPKDLP